VVYYFDISKAFDQIDFLSIQNTLISFNISPFIINLIIYLLKSRKSYTHLDGFDSEFSPISSGVAQGSPSGPIIFNLGFSKVFLLDDFGKMFKFADDLKIIFPLNNLSDSTRICLALYHLKRQLSYLGLKINESKTNFMTIGKTDPNLISYLSLSPNPSLKIKDLGIRYDSKLKIDTISKCSMTNMPIYFILRFIKCATLRLLVYRAKVLPHLDGHLE